MIVKPSGADCNLRCDYCFYLGTHYMYPEVKFPRMDDQILDILIRQLMEQSGREFTITWQGGEPTLMGLDFFQKVIGLEIRHAGKHSKNVGNCLQTNGSLLDENWADFLKKYNFLVGLSIDGPANIHDHYRKMGSNRASHGRAIRALQLLQQNGVEYNVLSTITSHSVGQAERIYRYFHELGIEWIQFFPALDIKHQSVSDEPVFAPDPVAYGQFLISIFDLWIHDYVHSEKAPVIRFIENIFHRYLGFNSPECTFMKNCGVYLVVEHNGDVFSCDYFVNSKHLLGNVKDENLVEMLNSPQQTDFGALKSKLDSDCRNCKWLELCNGGCTRYRYDGQYQYCESMKIFFEYTDEAFRILAAHWKKEHPLNETYDFSRHLTIPPIS